MKGERIYRLLLRVYPRSFRRRYTERLVEVFRKQRVCAEYASGRLGRVRFWLDLMSDLSRSAARLHVERLVDGWSSLWLLGSRDGANRRRRSVAMLGLGSDVRYALRGLRREPVFSAAALATIALGVAASTSAFSVLDAALVRPLPFADPDRLLFVSELHAEQSGGGATAPETYLTGSPARPRSSRWGPGRTTRVCIEATRWSKF